MAQSPLLAAITKLKKTYASAIKNVAEAGVIKRIYLSSPQLNYLFGGGFPLGRIINLHGPESGGKSTLATYVAGDLQKLRPMQKTTVYVDFERTFEKTFAENLGLNTDPDLFVFLRPENGEEGFTILEDLIRTGEVGLIVFDSDATMPSRNQLIDEYGKADFGAGAKLMAAALRKFNPLLDKYQASMFVISQERDNQAAAGGYGPDFKATGGKAIKFYASNRSRVQRIEYFKDKGIITGIQMRVKNEKNKAGIPYREALLTLDFEKGFDVNNEYMDFIISLGVAEQKGAWFYMPQYGLEKANGRDAVQDWLNHHPDEYTKIKLEVNDKLCGKLVIDEANEIVEDPDFEEPPEIPAPEEA
jgi:recombination protein RecA